MGIDPKKHGFVLVGKTDGYAVNRHGTSDSITLAKTIAAGGVRSYRQYQDAEGAVLLLPIVAVST